MTAPGCPRSADLLAALQGELSVHERAELDEHLIGCAACRREREELADVLGGLQGLSDGAWSPPRQLARRLRVWAPAAALLLSVSAWLLWTADDGGVTAAPPGRGLVEGSSPAGAPAATPLPRPSDLPAAPAEARWLAASLQPDGGWPAELLGPARQQASQHALALLALAQTDTTPEAVGRAADWLVARQRADGSLSSGLADGSTDQALAAAALLQAARHTGRPDLAAAGDRAVDHLLSLLEQGGRPVVTHPAQLAWVVEALRGAQAAGRLDVAPALARVCGGRASVRPSCEVAALRRDALGSARATPALGEVFAASLATLAAAGW